MEQFNRLKNVSRSTRRIYYVLLILAGIVLIYAFVTSRAGQAIIAVCCGGLVLLAVVGILSERGMKRT